MANSGGEKIFDLLDKCDEKSSNLTVTFDFYTPRSHFIILEKNTRTTHQPESWKLESYICDMMKVSQSISSGYDLTETNAPIILSMHRGSWYRSSIFHAHICVDTEEYLRVFRLREGGIPNWPSRDNVTRQWKASCKPDAYEANVRGYPYSSYHSQDVAKLQIKLKTKLQTKPDNISPHQRREEAFQGYRLVYHSSAPRIGFQIKEPNGNDDALESQRRLMLTMENFRCQHGISNPRPDEKSDDNGCHLCISISSTGFRDFPSPVFGYIQMTPSRFCDLAPRDILDGWARRFSEKEMPILT